MRGRPRLLARRHRPDDYQRALVRYRGDSRMTGTEVGSQCRRHAIGVAISACAFLGACSRDATPVFVPPPVDHDVQGSWRQNDAGVPGESFLVVLLESSGTVSGSGSFAGEAAPFGGLAESGSVASDSLRLQIVYTFDPTTFPTLSPDTAQFVGALAARDTINGSLTRDGFTSPLTLVRIPPSVDPP